MKVTGAAITRRNFLRGFAGFAGATPALRLPIGRTLSLALRSPSAEKLSRTLPEGEIEFECSNSSLNAGFAWAKKQALQYVRNGSPIGPWYEAALPGRNAFCMRDVSHMSTGAHLLGLGGRTRNMLRQFAAHVSASKKWCSWWEITGEGQPAPVDYKSDQDFWYDLPANFDVLNACYRQWLWSRDDAYISDPVFLNYYLHTVTDYEAAWDHNHKGLLQHLPGEGHMGIATYDEDLQDQVLVGADLVAAQYAAYRDYAAIRQAMGALSSSARFAAKAASLKAQYNREWWDPATKSFYGAIGEDGTMHAGLKASTGGSDIELPLYFGVTDPGPRTQSALDRLEGRLRPDHAARNGIIGGVEGISYLPDIFYMYGRSDAAYTVLRALIDPSLKRRTYPEISFAVVGHIGKGLMGLQPADRTATIETIPQLTPETSWAALRRVPVGHNTVALRHDGNKKSTLTNESGPPLRWEAHFSGSSGTLRVDGHTVPARPAASPGGDPRTYCVIPVQPGETHVVETVPA